MSYRVDIHAGPGVELKRGVAEKAEKALNSLADRPDGLHEAVHDARRRCKKIRAVLRPALGDDYDRENARYRDAAAMVSARRQSLRREAMAVAAKLLAEKPGALTRRVGAYWDAEEKLVPI